MTLDEKLKYPFGTENLQKILKFLNGLSKDEVTKNTESVKKVILFILFKKRISTDIIISDLGRARLDGKEWKKFSTATIKEFKQHMVNCIFNAIYVDAIAIKTMTDFMRFLKDSKKEICGSFKTSGGNFIKSIEYVLEYP